MATDWRGELGRRVRRAREELGLTRKALSEQSGLSLRFLADVEGGKANPSLSSLRDLALALQLGVEDLVAAEGESEAHRRAHRLLRRLDAASAKEALALLADANLAPSPSSLFLLGLRGAGKSTVGEEVAKRANLPFVELDRRIEEEAGMDLGALFDMHGEGHYRKLEHRVLKEILEDDRPRVVATGGGIVTHPESFTLLSRAAITVWLKAQPRDHWDRVVAQGDMRPMADRDRAWAELVELYERRAPLYAGADFTIDTSALALSGVIERILGLLPHSR
jgi:XRE family aerobic/anaerobic benzoate catabolism transcriptional regulator